MQYVALSNGVKMPILGYGVYQEQKTNASGVCWMR